MGCYKQNMGFSPTPSIPTTNHLSPLRFFFLFLLSHPCRCFYPTPSPPFLSLLFSLNLPLLFLPCRYSLDPQGEALLSWKKSLRSSTNALSTWNPSDSNPCKWFSITCNSNGDVTSITLTAVPIEGPLPSTFQPLSSLQSLVISSTNISGEIPKQLAANQRLTLLDLSNNAITGPIPSDLCKLPILQKLHLNSNSLVGDIPAAIGDLSNLTHLILYDNKLSGELPTTIGRLKNLVVLRAGGNGNLRGSIPPQIGNCSSLVVLGLADTSISGGLPSSIAMLGKIETIAIYTALLSGPIPGEISNCSNLKDLYLYQNSLTGHIPRALGALRQLKNLLLWQNNLRGPIPPELGSCQELQVVDLSVNALSGNIPPELGRLHRLKELQLSGNRLTGTIPVDLSNCSSLTDFELDSNKLTGEINVEFGKLPKLTLFYAWQNNLTGGVPESLADCGNLESLDLSYNRLSGSIPPRLFHLKNLTKLLLLSNELSGFIPPEVGNCSSLFRFRANDNLLAGTIPPEIGKLRRLNFLDLSQNILTGEIPVALSACESLAFVDLHSNRLTGSMPAALPVSIQHLDISDNALTGNLTERIGSSPELMKLVLAKNRLTGSIPPELHQCKKLQLLDLGDNGFSGSIPPELGELPSLDIALNLSCNRLSGEIPGELSRLRKLAELDLSHNELTGDLHVLASMQNLVTLNLSYNDFHGELPNTVFFKKLPWRDVEGNDRLYFVEGGGLGEKGRAAALSAMKVAMMVIVAASAGMLGVAIYMMVRSKWKVRQEEGGEDEWETTFFRKMEVEVEDVLRGLTASNVVGTGSSGVVYKVTLPGGETIAVKKMWSADDSPVFRSEITTLGTIRHRNVVRLLGWGANRTTKLLFYSYHPNGSLRSFLHGGGKIAADWDRRFEIALGLAHAVAYLHHDCVPPIIHGDVKAMNVLLGPLYEPYLADFGLARPVAVDGASNQHFSSKETERASPSFAGSYGYIAPEHASMQRITVKSDVYSYGVVLLEILTGKHPLDPSLPSGTHLVEWVLDHVRSKGEPTAILDPRLLPGRSEPQMQEMRQVLAISALCLSQRPSDRPSLQDVVALLKEIRRPPADVEKGSHDDATWKEPPPRNLSFRGSPQCSFAMSETSS